MSCGRFHLGPVTEITIPLGAGTEGLVHVCMACRRALTVEERTRYWRSQSKLLDLKIAAQRTLTEYLIAQLKK